MIVKSLRNLREPSFKALTKVPVFPSSSCREVPRLQEVCRQVAVRRPVARCRQVQCQEPRCREVATQQCSQRTSLKPVPSNQTVCATVPSKTCKTEKVKRLKLIPKKICTELKQTEEQKKLLLKVKDKEKPKDP